MAWLLSVVMVLGGFIFYGAETLTASAMTIEEFNARLSELQQKYPTGYVWKDKYYGKYELTGKYVNWVQCKGFAHLMGYEVFGTDPGTWEIDYDFSHLEPGDIIQFGNPSSANHSVFCTSVSGDTYYFVDCNGNGNRDENGKYKDGLCMVLWGDKGYISKGSLYNGARTFSYLLKSPMNLIPEPEKQIDLGSDFYGELIYNKEDMAVSNVSGNVEVRSRDAEQKYKVWHFIRQSNGSYVIISCSDHKAIDTLTVTK